MQNKSIFTALAFAVFVASCVAGYFGPSVYARYQKAAGQAAFKPGAVPKRQFGDFARDFAAVHVATEAKPFPDGATTDLDGRTVSLSRYRGRPLLVNLWASWCGPCVVELPSLEAFRKRYRDRIAVAAIAVEEPKSPEDLQAFLSGRRLEGLDYLKDGGGLTAALAVRGIPTSFLIGADGQIIYRFEGDADWSSPESYEFFDVFLLQSGK